MNLIEELKWRGLLHDVMPGTEEQLSKEMTKGYVGFDPTADSLHIGNFVPIMLLVHLQRAGHQPIALVGGATGMVGDPSGKTQERQFLNPDTIQHNLSCQKAQLEKFLDFDCGANSAMVVNNYDWFKEFSFLDFIRDVGKHITISYMMSKDSVKNRMETGMSFTEFSYQLVQGYDFYHLWKEMDCKIQMGGSDQWGNIVTGTELIRRKGSGEAFAITAPLITKADGSKFGKSEGGNVWLDKAKTSPYKFYQYWISSSDEDAAKYIRIFTLFDQERIEQIEAKHAENPGARHLQKELAAEVTRVVHSEKDLETALAASSLLFGKSSKEDLLKVSIEDLLAVFEGVPQATVSKADLAEGIDVIEALGSKTNFLSSNGEARRALKENAVQVNKEKVGMDARLTASDLLLDRVILLQKGKKNFYLLIVE
ncbi:MAG: tyrosine--tRNA ligase [Flavobacteriales bacterium]|nr:tyrosine--tRNA ligase [Flavobacteriales bacterium]MDG1779678.1 tyrosine--tRNA ligase [Flavobacteriales bacterium]MDG2245624.1 tyrosine--tRNA ligase [Flavobacteriales bacterium]